MTDRYERIREVLNGGVRNEGSADRRVYRHVPRRAVRCRACGWEVQVTVPADPGAAVEQAIVETLRREREEVRYERHPAR